jgi:hypothetical protein
MLAMVIGTAFCSVPLAVLLVPLMPDHRLHHANDNVIRRRHRVEGQNIIPLRRDPSSLNRASTLKAASGDADRRARGRVELLGRCLAVSSRNG